MTKDNTRLESQREEIYIGKPHYHARSRPWGNLQIATQRTGSLAQHVGPTKLKRHRSELREADALSSTGASQSKDA